MKFDTLKGKTVDDELIAKLQTQFDEFVAALTTRAETAEAKAKDAAKESISGRKTLKAERDAAFDKLGIATLDELEALPDAKGQGDALKQFEVKLKRAEREKAEAMQSLTEFQTKYTADQRALAIEKAVSAHAFIDVDDARVLIGSRLKAEGDQFLFNTPDGKDIPLSDGVAWLAKTKPHLVKPPGDGQQGSGFKPNSAGAPGQPAAPTLDIAAIYAARQPQAPAAAAR